MEVRRNHYRAGDPQRVAHERAPSEPDRISHAVQLTGVVLESRSNDVEGMKPTRKADGPTLAEDNLPALLDWLPNIAWTTAPDGTTEYLNGHGQKYVGPISGPTAFWNWADQTHSDDADEVAIAYQLGVLTETRISIECRLRRFDGAYRWHAVEATPVIDDDGIVVKWIGIARDINETKLHDDALRAAGIESAAAIATIETVVADAPVGLGLVDLDFRQVIVNETLARIRGLTVDEQIGQTVASLVPQLWSKLEPVYNMVLKTGEPVLDVELTGPSPEGTRRWTTSHYPVRAHGEIVGIGLVVVDITARVRAEQAQRQLSAIVQGSAAAIFGTDIDGYVTTWNAGAEHLLGYSRDDIVGRHTSLLFPTGADALWRLPVSREPDGISDRVETALRRADGSPVDVLVVTSPVTDGTGHVAGRSVIAQDIGDRLAAQRALGESERRLADAQRIAQVGSFELDLRTSILSWSAEHYRILGLDRKLPATGDLFNSLVHPDDRVMLAIAWAAATEHGTAFDLKFRIIRPDSQLRRVHSRAFAERNTQDAVTRLAGTLTDETDAFDSRRDQLAAEARFEISFEQAAIGAGLIGLDGIATRVNQAACRFLGRSADMLVGRNWDEFSHPAELPLGRAINARRDRDDDIYTDERRFVRPDGSVVWAIFNDVLVRDETGSPRYHFAQLEDITGRKQMERDLAYQALHDPLTGLPNRALLTDRVTQGLLNARLHSSSVGVMHVNVDHFKGINSSFGRAASDTLITHIAQQIAAVIAPTDTAARVGGDEFVVACFNSTIEETEATAYRILGAVAQPCLTSAEPMSATVSIGVTASSRASSPEDLLRDSGIAMYSAKSHGRNRVQLFDQSLRVSSEQQFATVTNLRRAIDRDEFTLRYQPVVNIDNGAMRSAEALVRWQHPDRGLVAPDEFVPLAEESGLIVPIGAWVLEQSCRQLIQWQRINPSMTVAVNLSVRQAVDPEIVGQVDEILNRTGVDPHSVCLELTESMFTGDIEYFARTLTRLKALGLRLSIDDFGTGYSSLSYLKRLPVDAVKIDKMFIDGLGTDPHDSALVAAILAMADALGLTVIAEGIETKKQLSTLRRLHCGRAQGYYFAEPMTAESMTELVAGRVPWGRN
jgi:diguanylate cyclase (GGDEF)-like protein/PAS domain S-box-containing protein